MNTAITPSYYRLLDEAWKQYLAAHPSSCPAGVLVSVDVGRFMLESGVYFLGDVRVHEGMPPATVCFFHAPI